MTAYFKAGCNYPIPKPKIFLESTDRPLSFAAIFKQNKCNQGNGIFKLLNKYGVILAIWKCFGSLWLETVGAITLKGVDDAVLLLLSKF